MSLLGRGLGLLALPIPGWESDLGSSGGGERHLLGPRGKACRFIAYWRHCWSLLLKSLLACTHGFEPSLPSLLVNAIGFFVEAS